MESEFDEVPGIAEHVSKNGSILASPRYDLPSSFPPQLSSWPSAHSGEAQSISVSIVRYDNKTKSPPRPVYRPVKECSDSYNQLLTCFLNASKDLSEGLDVSFSPFSLYVRGGMLSLRLCKSSPFDDLPRYRGQGVPTSCTNTTSNAPFAP